MNFKTKIRVKTHEHIVEIANRAVCPNVSGLESLLGTAMTSIDPLLDGQIIGGKATAKIKVDMPSGLKSAPTAGCRLADKAKLVFDSDREEDVYKVVSIPGVVSTALADGTREATSTFSQAVEDHFFNDVTSGVAYVDSHYLPLTSLVEIQEDYLE